MTKEWTEDVLRPDADVQGSGAERALARVALVAGRALPVSSRVALLEALPVIGRLDHPRFDIRMEVENQIELFRLGSCRKEPETVEWLERNVQPGDVVYDIGANVGAYSLIAAHLTGDAGAVYAFEPGFATYAKLVRNVLLNGLSERVTPLGIALSDAPGLTPISYSSVRSGGALHRFGERSGSWQPVLAYRLDDLIAAFSLRPPSHVKIDVDGAELKVLGGAPETFSSSALRTLLIEVTEGEPEADEITAVVESYGLALSSRHKHRSGVSNFVFTREER